VADIETRIAAGELRPGHAVDSESALSAHYGVARGTVRTALVELSSRGRIESVPGKGWFVRSVLGGTRVGIEKAEVVERLRGELDMGNQRPGELFLSERDVEDRYGLTRHAARAALAVLEAEGLIFAVHGRGRFVAKRD